VFPAALVANSTRLLSGGKKHHEKSRIVPFFTASPNALAVNRIWVMNDN
jgi:hypothetical protein